MQTFDRFLKKSRHVGLCFRVLKFKRFGRPTLQRVIGKFYKFSVAGIWRDSCSLMERFAGFLVLLFGDICGQPCACVSLSTLLAWIAQSYRVAPPSRIALRPPAT